MFHNIRDKNGNVIQTSRNLRGIREYVGKHLIVVLSIDKIHDGIGVLWIRFHNGSYFSTNFENFNVLRDFVRRWRNVYGAPLLVNWKDCGTVSSKNEALFDNPK